MKKKSPPAPTPRKLALDETGCHLVGGFLSDSEKKVLQAFEKYGHSISIEGHLIFPELLFGLAGKPFWLQKRFPRQSFPKKGIL